MTRDEELEIVVRIRTLVKLAILALRTAGHPTATLPLLAAPVSVSSGFPCLHRAIAIVERTTPIYPALGSGALSRAGFAVSALRTALLTVSVTPPPALPAELDRLLGAVLGALDDGSGAPLPSPDDERILLGIA